MNDEQFLAWIKRQEKAPRRQIGALAKVIDDALVIDAHLHNRPVGTQGTVLLGKAVKDRMDYCDRLLIKQADSLALRQEVYRHYILTKRLPSLSEEDQRRLMNRIEEMQWTQAAEDEDHE